MEGHRNFDLAHELFHILTWDSMPPKHVEDAGDFGGTRVEQLANHFAVAVLMPRVALESLGDCGLLEMDELIVRLNAAANELGVPSSALRWRLVALGRLARAKAQAIPESALRNNGRQDEAPTPPALFSRPFMDVIAAAIDRGHISVRRAAVLVGLPSEELQELFTVHGVDFAIDL